MDNKNISLELRKIANLIKRNFDKSFDKKITNTQCLILNYIENKSRSEIVVYQKDIEDFFDLRRSTICEILNIMEKNNLIKRSLSDVDMRSKEINLDTSGYLVLDEFQNKIQELEMIMKKDISEEELLLFFRLLEKFRKNLEEIC